jgi:Glycosyl transferase family 2
VISVVVTSHDYVRYLPRAIESVLAQTVPAELVVVDDGSTDGSPALAEELVGPEGVIRQENLGQAAAMNAGLERTSGDVVMFLDADDVLEPVAVARVAAAFASRPGLARVHWPMRVIDADGADTGILKPSDSLRLPAGDLRGRTLSTPFDTVWMATSGNAFAREALEKIAPVPLEFRICADWYLVHASSLVGPVHAIEVPLSRYRVHERNNYERSGAVVDLAQLRTTIATAGRTRRHLLRLAERMRLPRRCDAGPSFSDVGNRTISLRLDRSGHPLPDDSRLRLVGLGALALWRRGGPAGFVLGAFGWLLGAAFAPGPAVPSLARAFLDPAGRPSWLRRLARADR